MKLAPKNWRDFQHYKDRAPPWIRLHRKLLDDKDFQRLPTASRALAPMLWLLASESVEGSINADADDLAFRLRQPEAEIVEALKPLIDKGFFAVVEGDASALLAPCSHAATPETEQRQSRDRGIAEGEAPPPAASAPAPKPRRPAKTLIPADFAISDRVRKWADEKGHTQLDEHLDAFKRKCIAKGYANASWDDAFMEAIREDWAKLRGRAGVPVVDRSARNDAAKQMLFGRRGSQEVIDV